MYDVGEAYEILKRAKIVKRNYDIHEELISPHHVFTKNGRDALMQAVTNLVNVDAQVRVGIYTCGSYIFLIGCRTDRVFLVDTHSIGADLGGNGNGIVKVYPTNDHTATYQLCAWIWKRLRHSGVKAKAMQSFVVLHPRYV